MSVFVPPRPSPLKAGPIGTGAGALMTEYPLSFGLGFAQADPRRKMQRAWQLGVSVPWIRAAERVICGNFSSVAWHLEDGEDVEVDDAYPGRDAQEARALLEKPQANLSVGKKLTRSYLWWLTARHIGLCGNAFWYLDALNVYGLPAAVLYIRPDRMTPVEDEHGNLLGWFIDRDATNPGTKVPLEQVLHFMLEPPDIGHFGIGLVESALLKAQLSTALDQHLGQQLSAGGRLSGILSPKQGALDGDQYASLVRDWQTIVEQPDAAKRLQIVKAPVDFTPTTMSPQELQIRNLMDGARDDLITLWGVPLSQIGGTGPAGLNSGDTRKYDEAALWQNAIGPRLNGFRETVQFDLLDRWTAVGTTLELEIEEPEFDDDSPRYDLLGKSLNTPLTNAERRALIGLPPTGDPALDEAILLPATIVQYATAPGETSNAPTPTEQALGRAVETPSAQNEPAALAAGETSDGHGVMAGKADRTAPLHASLVRLRGNIEARMTPRLRRAVAEFLAGQKREVLARVRHDFAHFRANPGDSQSWWDARRWDKELTGILEGHLVGVAETVDAHIRSVLKPAKAEGDPSAIAIVLERAAKRVHGINETTRREIADLLAEAIDLGDDIDRIATKIEDATTFNEYRAELVSRTELMNAYNASAIGSYRDAGVDMVQAIDGDGDEECAARNGQTFTLAEADGIEDHPNGTLDWIPVIE